MYRLLERAAELDETFAKTANFSIDSKGHLEAEFADITQAIHIVQNEMGITGTTALEAGRTISGSIASMKSAWSNLLTGLADGNADVEGLINNLVTSIVGDGTENNLGVLGNVLPAVETALNGAAKLIEGAAPKIIQIFPGLVTKILPTLIDAATSLVGSLVAVLPDLLTSVLNVLTEQTPNLIQTVLDILLDVTQSLIQNTPLVIGAITQIISEMAMWIGEYSSVFAESAVSLMEALYSGIIENFPTLIDAALVTVRYFADAIIGAIPQLIDAAVMIVLQLVDFILDDNNLGAIIDASLEIILTVADGLVKAIPKLVDATIKIVEKLCDFLLDPENISMLIDMAFEIVTAIVQGLIEATPVLIKGAFNLITGLIDVFEDTEWIDIGKNIVNGIWSGLKSVWRSLKNWFSDSVDSLVGGVKGALGIHSPSRVFAGIGENMALGLGEGWEDEFGTIKKGIENGMDFGVANIEVGASMLGRNSSAINSAFSNFAANLEQNATIVVQSVLDGKVIGETAYQYSRNKLKAYGV